MSNDTQSAPTRIQALAKATKPFMRFFMHSLYSRKAGVVGVEIGYVR